MSYTPGRFVWFEHCSNDIAKARAFYEKLFGWNTELMAMPGSDPYPVIHNGDNGIGGYRQAPAGTPTRWLSYLSVSDVDSSYKAALAAGAKSLTAPMDYGSAGRAATIADPTGGVFSLWRGAEGDPAETETTPPGGWIWNELATQDEKTALAFYEKAFGFATTRCRCPTAPTTSSSKATRAAPVCTSRRTRRCRRSGRRTSASPTPTRPPSRRRASARPSSCRRRTFPESAGWRCSSIRWRASIAILKPNPSMR